MSDEKKPLQLQDFRILELQIRDAQPNTGSESSFSEDLKSCEPVVDFNLQQHKEDPFAWMLQMTVEVLEDDGDGFHRHIYAEMFGVFHYSHGYSDSEMSNITVINGGTILYGMLRGVLASVTGSFVMGPSLLPTIYMQDVAAAKAEKLTSPATSGAASSKSGKKRQKVKK